MCFSCFFRDDAAKELIVKKIDTEKIEKRDIICFACHLPCTTSHLYTTVDDNLKGMCDQCFFDFDHFDL